jgi:hypothetical protein
MHNTHTRGRRHFFFLGGGGVLVCCCPADALGHQTLGMSQHGGPSTPACWSGCTIPGINNKVKGTLQSCMPLLPFTAKMAGCVTSLYIGLWAWTTLLSWACPSFCTECNTKSCLRNRDPDLGHNRGRPASAQPRKRESLHWTHVIGGIPSMHLYIEGTERHD